MEKAKVPVSDSRANDLIECFQCSNDAFAGLPMILRCFCRLEKKQIAHVSCVDWIHLVSHFHLIGFMSLDTRAWWLEPRATRSTNGSEGVARAGLFHPWARWD